MTVADTLFLVWATGATLTAFWLWFLVTPMTRFSTLVALLCWPAYYIGLLYFLGRVDE